MATDPEPAWRSDFPVDWPEDAYVERRDFVKFLVLTSLAFTVGQGWIAAQNWWRRRRGAPEVMRIAPLSELPIGAVRSFTYPTPTDPCVLIRPSADAFVAYNQKCTHLSCAVIPRPSEGVIKCPCHDGLFDLASGRPLAGPPRRPLTRILLEIRDDVVYATGVKESLT
jgi:Rieske Fe-S protein